MKRINSAVWLDNQNRWQIKVQKDNERRTFTSSKPGRTGQREANAKADAWLDDGIVGTNKTIEKLWAEYIAYLQANKARTTWQQPLTFGRVWILSKVGRKRIDKFTDADFQSILDAAAAKPLAKKTILDIKNETTKFFTWCRRQKAGAYTPDDVTMPGNARSGKKNILQPSAVRQLFKSTKTTLKGQTIEDRLIHCYRYMLLTGLRPGEAMGLRRCDLVADCKITRICGAINQFNERTLGKNDNALREIINCELARQELLAHLQKYPDLVGEDLIFGELTQSAFRVYWQRYCAANEIPPITLYELRHTFLSYTERKYQNNDVNSYVGHSKEISSYIHDVDGYAEYTAALINRIFMDVLYSDEGTKSNVGYNVG